MSYNGIRVESSKGCYPAIKFMEWFDQVKGS